MDLKRWLDANGLGKYEALFAENEIDFDLLPKLTESDLDKLGLSVGMKRRLTVAIQSLGVASTPRGVEHSEDSDECERPGWEERLHYAEILRLKGWMLSLKGSQDEAKKNYLASLDCAREERAKSWELRTSTSLARLWQGQGKRKEAHEVLAPVYEWFTEGFDTRDLKDAKALLEELGA
jgi:hypothetical protein